VTVTCHYTRGCLIARVQGELDYCSAPAFRTAVEARLDETEALHLILNLEGLTFVDSSGLGALLGRYRRMVKAGGTVSLVGVSDQARRILEQAGIFRIIPVFKSEEQAVGV
jgi:stage II sporulation protein AA (anti-sigma F factor antagonist)